MAKSLASDLLPLQEPRRSMSRPLRLEFPGALYHITCRGDRHEAIYRSDADRAAHLQVLADGLDRFDA